MSVRRADELKLSYAKVSVKWFQMVHSSNHESVTNNQKNTTFISLWGVINVGLSHESCRGRCIRVFGREEESLFPVSDIRFSSVQSLSHVWLFVTPWTAARQVSLSTTNCQSLLKLMSSELVMPYNHLILCCRLLLLPSILPSIKVCSSESVLNIRWPKYWKFSFSISLPLNIQDWFPLGWTGWIFLLSKGLSRVYSKTTVKKHQFFPHSNHIIRYFSPTW